MPRLRPMASDLLWANRDVDEAAHAAVRHALKRREQFSSRFRARAVSSHIPMAAPTDASRARRKES